MPQANCFKKEILTVMRFDRITNAFEQFFTDELPG